MYTVLTSGVQRLLCDQGHILDELFQSHILSVSLSRIWIGNLGRVRHSSRNSIMDVLRYHYIHEFVQRYYEEMNQENYSEQPLFRQLLCVSEISFWETFYKLGNHSLTCLETQVCQAGKTKLLQTIQHYAAFLNRNCMIKETEGGAGVWKTAADTTGPVSDPAPVSAPSEPTTVSILMHANSQNEAPSYLKWSEFLGSVVRKPSLFYDSWVEIQKFCVLHMFT